MNSIGTIALWCLSLLLVALLAGNLAATAFGADPAETATAAPLALQKSQGPLPKDPGADLGISALLEEDLLTLAAAEEQLLINLYEKVSFSVVHIAVSTTFGGGTGSGFVLDTDGHIVTSNHVVEGAEQILVRFADDTLVEAELMGADADSDLAVLWVDVPPGILKPVQLGSSAALRVGQRAIAVGNPFGLEQTMTTGIISALGQVVRQESGFSLPHLIQTDAAINPGNSGGPLLDLRGQVIGVNTLIFSSSGSSAGVGFAVPVDTVKRVVPALIATGRYSDPWLGIGGLTITPIVAEALALPVEQGVLVQAVVEDGPADQAGLRGNHQQAELEGTSLPTRGDIILAIDGAIVRDMDDLVVYLAEKAVGQSVMLDINRGGERQNLEVILAERPQD